MNNYQKAKEEGINDFGKIDMGKQRIEDLTIEDLRKAILEVMNKLPSFAEKIKEGVLEDVKMSFRKIGKPGFGESDSQITNEKLKPIEKDYYSVAMEEERKLIGNFLNASEDSQSDSQTIKE